MTDVFQRFMRAASVSRIGRQFIIWTSQRTGGSNLMRFLTELGGYRGLHEPFSAGREYGHVTESWLAHEDVAELDGRVDEALTRGASIKHCVETTPWPVSDAILRAASESDLGHVFLVRRSAVDRLLSREYARRSGTWGPGFSRSWHLLDRSFRAPLDVDKLIALETQVRRRLNACWGTLGPEADRVGVSFEDLYEQSLDRATEAAERLLVFLDIEYGDSTAAATQGLRAAGDQRTRWRYRRFSRLEELRRRASGCPEFAFDA